MVGIVVCRSLKNECLTLRLHITSKVTGTEPGPSELPLNQQFTVKEANPVGCQTRPNILPGSMTLKELLAS